MLNLKTSIALAAAGLIAVGGTAAIAADWKSPHQAGRKAPTTRPQGDKAIIRTVADAMGFIRGIPPAETTSTINRVQIRGAGKVAVNGVMQPASSYIYTMSLALKGAREDIQFSGKTPPARITRVVLDKEAWDEKAPGVDGFATSDKPLNRRLQLARTPFGFTRALLDARPETIKVTDPGPRGKVTLVFPIEGVETTAVLDPDYRPVSISMTVDGQPIVTTFGAYADLSEYGLMFPTIWKETVAGKPRIDIKVAEGRVASYAVFPKPAALAAAR